jgi:hypothetical protein
MADPTTPNLNLYLPPDFSYPWGPQVRANFTILDTVVGNLQNPFKGQWNAGTQYSNGNFVLSSGVLWLALQNNINRPPISNNPTIWYPLSLGGTVPGALVFIDTTDASLFNLTVQNGELVLASGGISGITAFSSVVLFDTTNNNPYTVYVAAGIVQVEAGGSGGVSAIPMIDTITSDGYDLVVTAGVLALDS